MEKETNEIPTLVLAPRKKLDIIVVSDTHGSYKKLKPILNMTGDIFIHAGDFTYYGQ